jgi:hypothetical protein
VRRHGLRVRLRSVAGGRARLRLVAGGRTLAKVHRKLVAGRTRTVRVRPGKAGRRRLARAHHRIKARVKVRLPGETRTRVRRVRLR